MFLDVSNQFRFRHILILQRWRLRVKSSITQWLASAQVGRAVELARRNSGRWAKRTNRFRWDGGSGCMVFGFRGFQPFSHIAADLIRLGMTPIQEIKTEDIRGVIYVDTGTPGQVNAVKLILANGPIHVFSGDNLALALALAKKRFRPDPDEPRVADQQVKEQTAAPGQN